MDEALDAALRRHQALAQDMTLQLEIAENILFSFERCADAFQRLKGRGMTIAIDDFSTGYSSLSRLKQMAVDTLKINKIFIQGIPGSSDKQAITLALIAMAHSLGLKVIAEGVENLGQLAFLREHDCDEAQGYAISEVVDAGVMTRLLRAGMPPSVASLMH